MTMRVKIENLGPDMTMRVKIENLGPEWYEAILSTAETGHILKTLKMGESHELYVYPGNEVRISEVDAPKKAE